jgi:hypothetical protein
MTSTNDDCNSFTPYQTLKEIADVLRENLISCKDEPSAVRAIRKICREINKRLEKENLAIVEFPDQLKAVKTID